MVCDVTRRAIQIGNTTQRRVSSVGAERPCGGRWEAAPSRFRMTWGNVALRGADRSGSRRPRRYEHLGPVRVGCRSRSSAISCNCMEGSVFGSARAGTKVMPATLTDQDTPRTRALSPIHGLRGQAPFASQEKMHGTVHRGLQEHGKSLVDSGRF